jgi:preprotein translocase subunit SecA
MKRIRKCQSLSEGSMSIIYWCLVPNPLCVCYNSTVMLNLFNKLIDANQREVNRLSKIVTTITVLEPKIKKLSDKQLSAKTEDLKAKIKKGAPLPEILPEAYALVREASFRVNKARLFDVQLIAGIALHEGKIAEQKTGEGKTFTASSSAYLNGLTGKGVHIVTVNDYLAKRECGWVGPVYHLLGLTCATIVHDESFIYDPKYNNKEASDLRLKHLRPISRKEAYDADITYGTNNEFGFDYLRDNMAQSWMRIKPKRALLCHC